MATSYRNNTGVRVTRANLEQVKANLQILASLEVLVGFPEDTTQRDQDPNDKEEDRGITNAALGYIHDQGAPEVGIPQREFMKPAMEENKETLENQLHGALKQGMRGDAVKMEMAMVAAGTTAKLAIQKKIVEGVPPPLAKATLQRRARRSKYSSIAKAAALELDRREAMEAFGEDPFMDLEGSMALAKPLIDTGQMRNAVNFVIRAKSKRRDKS